MTVSKENGNLYKSCFEIPEQRANLALLELATQFRLLDNNENISNYLKQTNRTAFGKVIKQEGTEAE